MDEENKNNLEVPADDKPAENLNKCESERKDYLDGWQRAKADFINYKRDEGKRMEDMARFVTGGFINDLLPVMDSFDMALKNTAASEQERGILLIRSQMMDILKKRGFEQIAVKPGEVFNPEKHESLGEIEASYPEGSIAEIVQNGYVFRERVLRPARVRLAKNK